MLTGGHANNIGAVLESTTGAPSLDQPTFDQNTTAAASAAEPPEFHPRRHDRAKMVCWK